MYLNQTISLRLITPWEQPQNPKYKLNLFIDLLTMCQKKEKLYIWRSKKRDLSPPQSKVLHHPLLLWRRRTRKHLRYSWLLRYRGTTSTGWNRQRWRCGWRYWSRWWRWSDVTSDTTWRRWVFDSFSSSCCCSSYWFLSFWCHFKTKLREKRRKREQKKERKESL